MTGTVKTGEGSRVAPPLCARCGYDLSGLDPAGRCPECGAPVTDALRGDVLSAADPSWLARVHRGLVLIALGCLLLLLFIPTTLVLGVSGLLDTVPFLYVLVYATGPLGVAVLLAGIIGATSLDPRLSLREQAAGLRRLTRAAAVGALVLFSLKLVFVESDPTLGGALGVVSLVLGIVAFALLAYAPIGVTYYLARLAKRLPDPAWAAQMRKTAFKAVICFALAIALGAITRGRSFLAPLGNTWVIHALSVAGTVVMITSLVYAIALMNAWWALRKLIRSCLAEARLPAGSN